MTGSRPVVTVGRFGAVHGIKGFIRVHSFTQPTDNILDYQPWLVKTSRDETFKPVKFQHAEKHAKGLVVKLDGCLTREDAQLYINCDIAVYQDELPDLPAGEYYWSDLIGLTVVNRENITLGTVERLMETGSNDVIIVKNDDRQHYIPYILDDFVIEIDLDKKRMLVDWDESF